MKTVVGLYQHFDEAQQAVRALIDAGFDPNDVNMIAGDPNGEYSRYLQGDQNQKQDISDGAAKGAGVGAVLGALGGLLVGLGALAIPGVGPVIAAGPIAGALTGLGVGAVAGGVVGALVDLGIPKEHAEAYQEGIRRGGTLVTVQADDQMANQAEDILNRFNPVDMSRRDVFDTWGSQTAQTDTGMHSMHDEGMIDTGMHDMEDTDFERESTMDQASVPVTGRDMTDTSIPIVEEDLQVGKREVDRGGVRVDKNIEETPVEKDINLRQEHVTVERRPVDRPASPEDINAFDEGTFEVRETGEEPMVNKTARVVEEVNINKDVNEETRTINDTVRRTNVEVTPLDARYDRDYRNDFQTRYMSSGNDYDYYQPAYRFGYDLANNQQYRDYDWQRMEPIARQQWQQQHQDTAWDDVKEAIHHAWTSVTRRM